MRRAGPAPPRSAVALEYTGRGAPRVTAKGRGELAEKIIELARKHDVPISEDRELNELLCRVELGDEIPTELYVAVAEVLSFAYSLRAKALPTPERPKKT